MQDVGIILRDFGSFGLTESGPFSGRDHHNDPFLSLSIRSSTAYGP